MSSAEIILYDIPGHTKEEKQPRCWSLNPWKARMALNYKQLPYRTEWVEYPDIAPTFKELGIPPNTRDPKFEYSCPAAKFPDGQYVMDSRNICEHLDKIHPTPTLHMEDASGVIDETMKALGAVFEHLRPLALPRVPTTLLAKPSAEYFFHTRQEMFGMGLPDLAVTNEAQHAIRNARPHLYGLKRVMTEHKTTGEGPFVLGKEPSFADFVVAGAFSFLKDLDRLGDLFDPIVNSDPVFEEHWKACQPWLERRH